MSRLTDLIKQAKKLDPKLGEDLEAEITPLTERVPFGLNFERHVPESTELPHATIRKGAKVRVLPPRGSASAGDNRLYEVLRVERVDGGKVAHIRPARVHGAEVRVVATDDLVVVAEFEDYIYPGLKSMGVIPKAGDQPWHAVINGENYHALETLLYTHTEKIDCIYIDPPYNTGNDDWIYNDRHVAADDLYRHSKWLAFMERRLLLARDLLKDTGIIIVAIGDDQHHRLRMLMDQVFHESNFIANVTWEAVRKNDAAFVSPTVDYMLIYARSAAVLTSRGIRWSEAKGGVDEAIERAQKCWTEAGGNADEAQRLFRAWWRTLPASHPCVLAKGMKAYNHIGIAPSGEVAPYRLLPSASPSPRPNLRFSVTDPATGRIFPPPANGWRWEPSEMQRRVEIGLIDFPRKPGGVVNYRRFLERGDRETVSPVFNQDRARASGHLKDVLAGARFPYPKDHRVLLRWIGLVAGKDATILDFFGGSGSTLEAVMRLNAQDGGTRQCILVTNNEVGSKEEKALRKAGHRKGDPEWEAKGVYEYVTRPRITAAVTGERPDGSTYDDTVDANVEFFDLTHESVWRVSQNRAFTSIAPLLWLKAGGIGSRIDSVVEGWAVADVYGVLEDLDLSGPFVEVLEPNERVQMAFIVTDDDRRFQDVCADLPERVEPVRLYESYLRNFEINKRRR